MGRAQGQNSAPGLESSGWGLLLVIEFVCSVHPSDFNGRDSFTRTVSSHCSVYPPVPGQESSLRWAGRAFAEIPIAHIKASYNK